MRTHFQGQTISWLTFWFFPNEIFLPGAFFPGFVAILKVLRWILEVTTHDEEEEEKESHTCIW